MSGSENRRTSYGAIFDVKPVDDSGLVDVEKVNRPTALVNLSSMRLKEKDTPLSIDDTVASESIELSKPLPLPQITLPRRGRGRPPKVSAVAKELPAQTQKPVPVNEEDFGALLNSELDIDVELAKVGGERPDGMPNLLRARNQVIRLASQPKKFAIPSPVQPTLNPAYQNILAEIHHSASGIRPLEAEPAVAPEKVAEPVVASIVSIEPLAAHVDVSPTIPTKGPIISRKSALRTDTTRPRRKKKWFFFSIALVVGAALITGFGFNLKQQVVNESVSAVENINNAKESLKSLQFTDAAQSFAAAYDSFSKAGSSLNFMGSTISNAIASLPGGQTVKSAQSLVKVGQLLSDAGAAMSEAIGALAKTGGAFDPSSGSVSVATIASTLQKALSISQADVAQASTLLPDIDPSIIPADKQDVFTQLKSLLPTFQTAITQGADYAKFFNTMVGATGSKNYLLMFDNPAELRPTGGFPGTYGILSFDNGKLGDLTVDDVYNIDGQMKEAIIPPLQMQHITPTLGMRDVAWFPDYPTSARKIEEYYTKESQQSVDGVIVINPALIARILTVVGPIQMPQYGLTLTADNILVTLQSEVEYGPNRTQPKQVIKDLEPLLLAKIIAASSDQWMQIFQTLVAGMDQREVLMYFNNLNLESFATDHGFGGQVNQTTSDFLMPVITNVKGSKTDAVTDTTFTLGTTFDGTTAEHTLTIARQHNGGTSKYGFYNKQNPAYVRVLVPQGAQLVSVVGNDNPDFKPLVDYTSGGFVADPDIQKFETSGSQLAGVDTYHESGKTEFGFWLITDPGKSKTVMLTYTVPNAITKNIYNLYVQKQPGLVVKNFNFSLVNPTGLSADASYPTLTAGDTGYSYSAPLTTDLPIKVEFQ